ncbi:hypothetical protein Tco_0397732 [Tanacetum coccineum]
MGLTTPSHSLTHPSLSIKPQPIPPWQIEMIRLGDVTCVLKGERRDWRVKIEARRRIEKMGLAQVSGIKPPSFQLEKKAVGQLIDMDLFNLISAPNPAVIKTGTRPRAAHEVPLLTATANLVINMEDPTMATESFRTPSTIEKSPLDFDNENPSQQTIEGDGAENQAQETVASETLPPGNSPTTRVAPNRDP